MHAVTVFQLPVTLVHVLIEFCFRLVPSIHREDWAAGFPSESNIQSLKVIT
jgi:hypothetical protein